MSRSVIQLTLGAALCAALLAGSAQAQRVASPTAVETFTRPVITLTPRCDTTTVWDNIRKIHVTKETGMVIFKMTVTGTAAGLVVENPVDGVQKAVVNGDDALPIMPGSSYLSFHDANGAPYPLGLQVGNQSRPPLSTQPIDVAWNWPTGLALIKNYWWSKNHCNNVPVGPLIAKDAIKQNDVKIPH